MEFVSESAFLFLGSLYRKFHQRCPDARARARVVSLTLPNQVSLTLPNYIATVLVSHDAFMFCKWGGARGQGPG